MASAYLIGFGNTGSHLYYALKKSGIFNKLFVKKNHKQKINAKEFSLAEAVFICTEDSKIESAAKEILKTKIDLTGKYIFHLSGALSSEILKPLAGKGAYTGSFHPVQTFEKRAAKYSGRFKGIYIALEGGKSSLAFTRKIVRALGSKSVFLSAENKVLHHICCVFASNYLASHFQQAEEISKKIFKNGFNNTSFFGIYKPLVMQTLQNIEAKGVIQSLTGPIERNDIKTIKLHLKTMERVIPEAVSTYSFMGMETVILAFKKRSITKKEAENMIKLFTGYLSK